MAEPMTNDEAIYAAASMELSAYLQARYDAGDDPVMLCQICMDCALSLSRSMDFADPIALAMFVGRLNAKELKVSKQ